MSHKLSIVAAAVKIFFPSVYVIGKTCFDKFFFHAITGEHYFLYKFIVIQIFFVSAILLYSFKKKFWKKSVFYIRYLHNNGIMLLIPKVQSKAFIF